MNFIIKFGSIDLHSFDISSTNNKYKVLLFPQLMNPFLGNVPKEIEIKLLCKFYYPVESSGKNGLYQCFIRYVGKSSNEIEVGNCKFQLLSTSCICMITVTIKKDMLETTSEVVFKSLITYTPESSRTAVEHLASSKLRVELTNINKLIWMKFFYNETFNTGLMIGLPRMSLDRKLLFEIPFAFIPSPINRNMDSFSISIQFQKSVQVDRIDKSEYLISHDIVFSTEQADTILDVTFYAADNIQKSSTKNLEKLFVLVLDIKDVSHPLKISALSYQVYYKMKKYDHFFSDKKGPTVINIPISNVENNCIIPVAESIPLISRLADHNKAYSLDKDHFKIYYPYGLNIVDITSRLDCQTFNQSILSCPNFLRPMSEKLSPLIYNKESLEWSLKLKSEDLQVIVDVKPELITGESWEISMDDHVLNRISGWKGPNRRSATALLLDTHCESIYQTVPFKIYRNVTFYNPSTLETKTMMIDVTNQIKLKNIMVSPKNAIIYRYGNNFIMQGINEGNLVLELRDSDRTLLTSKNMKVFNRDVYIKDLEVSCISSVSALSNSSNFSFLIDIHDVKLNFQTFNKSQNCLIVVDLIYSDDSRSNILTFPMEQFSMRFITNTEIFEVIDSNNMFYNYNKFNKETAFNIEIQEAKICLRPRIIFKKNINIDPSAHSRTTLENRVNSTTQPVTSSEMMITTNKSGNSELTAGFISSNSFHRAIYILCGIFAVVLLILICKFLKDFIGRKKHGNLLARRSRPREKDKIGSPDKLHFENDYPPLLPSPGPQIEMVDNIAVTMSSPQSFWCINPDNTLTNKKSQPFVRQYSLPVKGCPMKDDHNRSQQCQNLRWIQPMMPEDSKINVYTSNEDLDNSQLPMKMTGYPMTWSVTQMEEDHSSGIGSLLTNIDDFLKDPYESKDRYNKLIINKRETVYEAI